MRFGLRLFELQTSEPQPTCTRSRAVKRLLAASFPPKREEVASPCLEQLILFHGCRADCYLPMKSQQAIGVLGGCCVGIFFRGRWWWGGWGFVAARIVADSAEVGCAAG